MIGSVVVQLSKRDRILPRRSYRVDEAAEMIGASVKTLRREIKEGKLRAHRLRRVLVIFVADWERYLAGLPVEPSAVDMVPAVSRADARPAMGGRIQRLFDPREVVG